MRASGVWHVLDLERPCVQRPVAEHPAGERLLERDRAQTVQADGDALFRVTPCTRKIFSVVTTNRVRSQRQTAANELTPAIPITSGPAIGNGHGIARKNSPAIASAIARRNGRTSTTL